MKLLGAFILSLLPLSTLAQKKSAKADRFQTFHSRALSTSGSPKLDESSYDDLIRTPRNYSAAILLTAKEDRFGCQLCREFQPEWDLLAKSWVKGDLAGESRVVFGTLDFADGKGAFQRLQLQTVPILVVYPPTVGDHAKTAGDPYRYSFNDGYIHPLNHLISFGVVANGLASDRQGDASKIHDWVARHLPPGGPRPPIARPVNYIKIVTVTTAVLGLITFFTVAAPYLLPIVQNRNLWAAITLIAILLFTSGHMFNHIRKVPYVSGDGRGGLSYFANGFQSQYGLETQIVAAMCSCLLFDFLTMGVLDDKS